MLETIRYVRKPFFIDSVQVTEENMDQVAKWCGGMIQTDSPDTPEGGQYIKVKVHRPLNDKQTKAYVGSWVLYAGTGFKVYTDKAFKASFQIAEGKQTVLVDTDHPLPQVIKKPAKKAAKKTRTAVQRTPVHGEVTVVVQEAPPFDSAQSRA